MKPTRLLAAILVAIAALACAATAQATIPTVTFSGGTKLYVEGSGTNGESNESSAPGCAVDSGQTTTGDATCWYNNYWNGNASDISSEVTPYTFGFAGGRYYTIYPGAPVSYVSSEAAPPQNATTTGTQITATTNGSYTGMATQGVNPWSSATSVASVPSEQNSVYLYGAVEAPDGEYVGVGHGEDLNVCYSTALSACQFNGTRLYQNTILNTQPASTCAWYFGPGWVDAGSGYNIPSSDCSTNNSSDKCSANSPWFDGTKPNALCNYSFFIDGYGPGLFSTTPYDVQWTDDGPIVWPHCAYRVSSTNQTPTSQGVREGHLSYFGGTYMYMTFHDTCPGAWQISLAREPIADDGAEGDWQVWNGSSWVASLPSGLNSSNYTTMLNQDGPDAASLVSQPSGWQLMSFQIGQLATTTDGDNYFAVGEMYEPTNNDTFDSAGTLCIATSFAASITGTWTTPTCVSGTTNSGHDIMPTIANQTSGMSYGESVSTGDYIMESGLYRQTLTITP